MCRRDLVCRRRNLGTDAVSKHWNFLLYGASLRGFRALGKPKLSVTCNDRAVRHATHSPQTAHGSTRRVGVYRDGGERVTYQVPECFSQHLVLAFVHDGATNEPPMSSFFS